MIFATMKRNRSVSAGRDGAALQIQGTEALSWMKLQPPDGTGPPADRQEERRTQCAEVRKKEGHSVRTGRKREGHSVQKAGKRADKSGEGSGRGTLKEEQIWTEKVSGITQK